MSVFYGNTGIRLFIVDRKQVRLCIDDVEWAWRYMYVQNMLKGSASFARFARAQWPHDHESREAKMVIIVCYRGIGYFLTGFITRGGGDTYTG